MIAEQKILVDGKNQLIINVDTEYSIKELNKYKDKFDVLKENGVILQNDFNDFTWVVKGDHKDYGRTANMMFNISKHPDVNTALKCFSLLMLEKGTTGMSVSFLVSLLIKAINATNCFADDMIEEFEEFVYKLPASSKVRLASVIEMFFLFYPFEQMIDDYIEVIDTIVVPETKVRKIPNYKSILRFDEAIKRIIVKENNEDIKLKYYPLFLWWIITGVIPLRATEFCELGYGCNFIEKERYWLKIPRNKVKQTSTANVIEIVDIQEINEFTYTFIEHYKSMLKPEHKSEYLLSWRAYNYFSPTSVGLKLKKNPEIIGTAQIRTLFKEFYKEYINDEKVIALKPGDSRHIAFCNLMLQGHNPIAIARFGGHTQLISQTHYYEHLDSYAESFVFAMAEKNQLNKMFTQTSGNREVNRRARVISTFEPAELKEFLAIEKGYCTIKQPGCTEFSGCEESCWDCSYHYMDLDKRKDAQIYLQQRSDKLGEIIHEQIDLLKSISKSMYIDLKFNECSFNGVARLGSTAEQLQTTMAKKIVIDSKLLEFVMED